MGSPLTTPSVGSAIKKMLAINPDLEAQELIDILKQSVRKADPSANPNPEFSNVDVIDIEKAVSLAQATLNAQT